ncbi:MAG: DUF192 domain-containing protein [Alphaproteobacteria bacterium]|nr:DUF192 domain-containing protein [Alphaproteobacteria bacterium]
MRYLFLILCASFCCTESAQAQGLATFAYQRGTLQLLRAHPPAAPALPWEGEDATAQPTNPLVQVEVDIRPADSLYRQEGWVNMGSLSGLNGMFFLFNPPQPAPIAPMKYYQPLDVLWIDENGKITSIAPLLNLSELSEPLADSKPSKAILLLAGGVTDAQSIRPGDKIVSSEFFAPPPKVLTAP